MTPLLLAPAGLLALAALVVPPLIHLARRTEERPTDFAAWRWLQAAPRPRRRPRLDERVLLAVRLGLLAALALYLAQPVLAGTTARSAVLAVVPGADPARARAMAPRDARTVWLAPGFPPLDQPAPASKPPVTSLVRQLDADLPPGAALTVLVPSVIEGADAERPRLSRAVRWQVVPGRMAVAPLPRPAPIRLAVRYTPGVAGLRYLAAAARALSPVGQADIAAASAPLPGAGPLAWWARGPVPDAVARRAAAGNSVLLPAGAALPGPATIIWRDPLGTTLAEAARIGRGRLIRFVRPLTPASMPIILEPGFPAAITALLAPAPAPNRAPAAELAPTTGGPFPTVLASRTDLKPLLATVIALLFLVERWLATSRRRAPAT